MLSQPRGSAGLARSRSEGETASSYRISHPEPLCSYANFRALGDCLPLRRMCLTTTHHREEDAQHLPIDFDKLAGFAGVSNEIKTEEFDRSRAKRKW